jgi:hypothetical protein
VNAATVSRTEKTGTIATIGAASMKPARLPNASVDPDAAAFLPPAPLVSS